VDYFLFSSHEGGHIYLYPSQGKIASGMSYEVGQEDLALNATLHKQFKRELEDFFKDKVSPQRDDL
jgi:hypothetical protein